MRYFKLIQDGYILSIGEGYDGFEISEDEYNEIMTVIAAKPEAEKGFDYRLKEDLTWELVEAPIIEPSDDDEISDEEALAIIQGQVMSE